MGTGSCFPGGIKWPGREANHSPSFSVENDTGGAVPPLAHTSRWLGNLWTDWGSLGQTQSVYVPSRRCAMCLHYRHKLNALPRYDVS